MYCGQRAHARIGGACPDPPSQRPMVLRLHVDVDLGHRQPARGKARQRRGRRARRGHHAAVLGFFRMAWRGTVLERLIGRPTRARGRGPRRSPRPRSRGCSRRGVHSMSPWAARSKIALARAGPAEIDMQSTSSMTTRRGRRRPQGAAIAKPAASAVADPPHPRPAHGAQAPARRCHTSRSACSPLIYRAPPSGLVTVILRSEQHSGETVGYPGTPSGVTSFSLRCFAHFPVAPAGHRVGKTTTGGRRDTRRHPLHFDRAAAVLLARKITVTKPELEPAREIAVEQALREVWQRLAGAELMCWPRVRWIRHRRRRWLHDRRALALQRPLPLAVLEVNCMSISAGPARAKAILEARSRGRRPWTPRRLHPRLRGRRLRRGHRPRARVGRPPRPDPPGQGRVLPSHPKYPRTAA